MLILMISEVVQELGDHLHPGLHHRAGHAEVVAPVPTIVMEMVLATSRFVNRVSLKPKLSQYFARFSQGCSMCTLLALFIEI